MKNIKILITALLLSFGLTNCASRQEKNSDAHIGRLVNNPNTFLVDVRTPQEYAAEPVEDAINIPLDEIPQRIDEFKGRKNIVVYCRSGQRATKAEEILKENNIPNVYSGTSYSRVSNLKK